MLPQDRGQQMFLKTFPVLIIGAASAWSWSFSVDKVIHGQCAHRLLFGSTFSFEAIERGWVQGGQVAYLKCLEWGGEDQDHYLLRLSAALLELQHCHYYYKENPKGGLYLWNELTKAALSYSCSSEMACICQMYSLLFAWSSRVCGQKLCWSLLVLELVCMCVAILPSSSVFLQR